jgi:GNAT superfamily N-acetyltransferase
VSTIRPLRSEDEAGAEAAWDLAYRTLLEGANLPVPPRTPGSIEDARRRMAYLRSTDPGGSWVAESDGEIVGVAQAHLRGDTWVLATLGVVPHRQDRGLGRALLDRALAYGDPESPGAIFSSPDPRAVYRYVRAGFTLHPAATAHGPVRRPVARQPGVRDGSLDDLGIVDGVDAEVRGSVRRSDVGFLLSLGSELLVDEDGGYALVRGGRLSMLAALDEEIAVRLLLDAVSRSQGHGTVDVSWLTAGQQWAVRTLALAGVPIHVHESIMVRGRWEPRHPYLPNGIFG